MKYDTILNHLRQWRRYKRMMEELNNEKITISIHRPDVNDICKIIERAYDLSVALDTIKRELYESSFDDNTVDAVIAIIETAVNAQQLFEKE